MNSRPRLHDMDLNSLKLVIIEDEEAHFSLMKRAIERELPQVTVHYFAHAGACLQCLEEVGPDVIVTDYLMPDMDGIEFLKALKERGKDLPVIVITGQGNENVAVQAMKLGAWDYLVKSPDFFTLLPAVIDKVVREWNLKESLRESESRFHDLAERTAEWIWEVDHKGRYVYSNQVVQQILGYDPDELIGRPYFSVLRLVDGEPVKEYIFRIASQRKILSVLEMCASDKEGKEVILETSAAPVLDKAGGLVGYRGIHRDITERKLAEEALKESESRLRDLSSRLLSAQEEERKYVAKELHDSIGQTLAAIMVYSGNALMQVGGEKAETPISNILTSITSMVKNAVEELRRIQRNLWPSLLDDLGVLKTVQGFCRAYNEVYAGIRIEIDLGVEEADVPSRLRIVIYRIIQEAFNNIAKHSRANLATISLQKTESGFDLLITDNGSGFDPAAVSRDGPSLTGLGLSTMKERTELSGGIFSIDSMPGKGTSIRCSWTV